MASICKIQKEHSGRNPGLTMGDVGKWAVVDDDGAIVNYAPYLTDLIGTIEMLIEGAQIEQIEIGLPSSSTGGRRP